MILLIGCLTLWAGPTENKETAEEAAAETDEAVEEAVTEEVVEEAAAEAADGVDTTEETP